MTDDGRRKAEDGGRKAEDGRRKTETPSPSPSREGRGAVLHVGVKPRKSGCLCLADNLREAAGQLLPLRWGRLGGGVDPPQPTMGGGVSVTDGGDIAAVEGGATGRGCRERARGPMTVIFFAAPHSCTGPRRRISHKRPPAEDHGNGIIGEALGIARVPVISIFLQAAVDALGDATKAFASSFFETVFPARPHGRGEAHGCNEAPEASAAACLRYQEMIPAECSEPAM